MKDSLLKYWKKINLIKDKRLIEAFKKIKREDFILEKDVKRAYGDYPLDIDYGQTISQPSTVMIMTESLELKEGNKVLEVGTGSGYQAAIIAELIGKTGKVYTTEIVNELVAFAKENLKKAKIKNVEIIKKDGSSGLKKFAPYDKIILTAACAKIPDVLIKQLNDPGILVAPVGPLYMQEMIKLIKKSGTIERINLGNFVFVPLKGEFGYS